MYGNNDPAGVVATDAGGPDDPEQRLRRAQDLLSRWNATAKEACDRGEWKLQREAEDAAGRLFSHIQTLQRQAEEGQRSGQGVHGEDPEAAEVNNTPPPPAG